MRRLLAISLSVALAAAQDGPDQRAPRPFLDPAAAGSAKHIWHPDGGATVFFRRTFELPAGARSVRLVASCDDLCTLFVNGERVAEASAWETLVVVDLVEAKVGKNVVAVRGGDRGGAAALAVWILWQDQDGAHHYLGSDQEWRCSAAEREGWQQLAFDDAKWDRALENGDVPFGKTTYGFDPVNYVIVDRYKEMADAIEHALQAMRAAGEDDGAALRSLAEIERAVVRARQAIWERREQRRMRGPVPGQDGAPRSGRKD